jgi:hypothetical protein
MKIAIDIADALVADLSGLLTESATVVRRVLPEFELAELKDLTVAVVPKSVEMTNITRQSTQYDITVDVGIQQKIGKDTDAEVLVLGGIVSDIVAFLNRRSLPTCEARFKTIANEPVYAPEMLSEKRLFLSVITVTYTVME